MRAGRRQQEQQNKWKAELGARRRTGILRVQVAVANGSRRRRATNSFRQKHLGGGPFRRHLGIYPDDAPLPGSGDAEVEELALIVGRYLGGLIDLVFAWGGDIEKLYGDAFLAFWPASEPDRDGAVRNALGCASVMVSCYDNQITEDGTALRLRGALAAGDLCAVQAGGRSGQWHFFLAGPSLSSLSDMLAVAPPGKIFSSAGVRSAFPRLPELATSAQIDAAVKMAARPTPVPDVPPEGPPASVPARALAPAGSAKRRMAG